MPVLTYHNLDIMLPVKKPELWRRLLAEGTGTFMITIAAMGVDILFFTGHHVDDVSRWLARGLVTAVAIYAFSAVSGAHANPAVTLAFAARGVFPWARAVAYVAAQFAGAFLAAGLSCAAFGQAAALGASHPGPGFSPPFAAITEAVLTALLVVVILATANEEAIVGEEAALAVGFAVAVCGFFGGAISGASMNPARTIAPQLLTGQGGLAWVYIVGPLTGALLAVGVHRLIFGAPQRSEEKVAHGGRAPVRGGRRPIAE